MIDLERAHMEYRQRREALALIRERAAKQMAAFAEYLRTRREAERDHSGEAAG